MEYIDDFSIFISVSPGTIISRVKVSDAFTLSHQSLSTFVPIVVDHYCGNAFLLLLVPNCSEHCQNLQLREGKNNVK